MAKSLIEKYQKALAADPTDLVFVELAKVLIEKGEAARAAEVCARGVEHHPHSVVGRVLWGKALLGCSRPAEAMEQFDRAMALERDNPYAYNLVGEVLLHKGLHRSAVPILKKALALQPDDPRVRQWLEQATRGPGDSTASGNRDSTAVDAAPVPDPDAGAEPTLTDAQAYHPVETVPGVAELLASLSTSPPATATPLAAPPGPSRTDSLLPYDLPTEEVHLGQGSMAPTLPEMPALPSPCAPARDEPVLGLPAGLRDALARKTANPDVTDAAEVLGAWDPSAGDPVDGPIEVGAADLEPFAIPPPLPRRPGLFAELTEEPPTHFPPSLSMEMPSVVLAQDAAEEVAREYERELRERLLAAPPPGFLRRSWLPLSAAGVLAVVLCAGFAVYLGTRRQNRDRDLSQLRVQSLRALALATPSGYRDAIDLADRALSLSPGDEGAQAVQVFASAALFHRFEPDAVLKAAAAGQLPATRRAHPAMALAADYFLADDPARLEAAKAAIVQESLAPLPKDFAGAELLFLAGRLLLAGGKTEEALARFKAALESDPAHVDTLVALGNYYLGQGEPEQAIRFFGRARQASPDHVLALLGGVNAALELSVGDPASDLVRARAAFGEGPGAWPESMLPDLDLAEGRTLALGGRYPEASARLSTGAFEHRGRAADFYAALGDVEVLSGNYEKAEAALVKAIAARPGDARLREELARALVAQGRPVEAIRATEGSFADDRQLRVVRGLARLELGQHGRAREELLATSRNRKVPTEAAIYLALIDLAQGQRETARQVLEDAAKAAQGRGTAHVALGRLHLEAGRTEAAAQAFAAATADRRDWEGACSLGRLLLGEHRFNEAKTWLELAISRNRGHAEARVALGEALLALGEVAKARDEMVAAQSALSTPGGHRGMAQVLSAQGDLAAARRQLQLAVRLEPGHPDNARIGAELSLLSGDAPAAIRGLERAARARPKDPAGFCELGEAHLRVADPAAARRAFETALRVERGNQRARLGLVAAALPESARQVQAESQALVREVEKGPAPSRARALALNSRVLLSLGEKEGALERAHAAVAASDASADAHLALGLAAKAANDPLLALQALQRVVTMNPSLAEAHLALADSLARIPERLPQALAEAEIYLRIAPRGTDAATARKFVAAMEKKLAGR